MLTSGVLMPIGGDPRSQLRAVFGSGDAEDPVEIPSAVGPIIVDSVYYNHMARDTPKGRRASYRILMLFSSRLISVTLNKGCLETWAMRCLQEKGAIHVRRVLRDRRFGLMLRTNLILLAFNVIGALTYLWYVSSSWRIPAEKAAGINSVSGEPFVWAAGVLYIFAPFVLVDAVWGVLILSVRQWNGGRLWLLAALTWLVALVIDFAHH